MATQPKYPGIPVPSADMQSVVKTLLALKESIEIGQRLRGDQLDSFVRLRDLQDLGLLRTSGSSIVTDGTDHGALSGLLDDDHPQYLNTSRGDVRYLAAGTPVGETNAGQNLGAGSQVYSGKSGTLLQFRSLIASAFAALTQNANDITVAAQAQKTASWVNGTSAIVAASAPIVAVHIPVACTIKKIVIVTQGGPGNCTVIVRRTTLASFGAGSSINGGGSVISAGQVLNDSTLSGWTTSLAADDVLLFQLSASTNFNYIHVSLLLG